MSNKKSNATFHKVGAVLRKEKGGGTFVVLGNPNAKNEKYKNSVEITLKDASGKVVLSKQNGFLTVLDPRKRPGLSDEDAEKIPDRLVSELFLVQDND